MSGFQQSPDAFSHVTGTAVSSQMIRIRLLEVNLSQDIRGEFLRSIVGVGAFILEVNLSQDIRGEFLRSTIGVGAFISERTTIEYDLCKIGTGSL